MEYTRSPLRIVVRHAASKGHVLAINTTAYVYRRSERSKARLSYWYPNGEYFVRFSTFNFPVTFNGENGFVMEASVADWLRMLSMFKEKANNGASDQQGTAESGG